MFYKVAALCVLLPLCTKAMDNQQVIHVKAIKQNLAYHLNNNRINTIGDLKNAIVVAEDMPASQQVLYPVQTYWYVFSKVVPTELSDNLSVMTVMSHFNTNTLYLYPRLN